jgi:ethanolamine utilization protein EutJ
MSVPVDKIRQLLNRPDQWDFSGAERLYAGVDLGTYKASVIVIDEKGTPRAAGMRKAEVVRSGLIVDYIGALRIVRELIADIRARSPLPLEKGATSYPPKTESANVHTTAHILEGADLEVLKVLDEPTAANQVLNLKNGVIVDVGGGTTGVAVIENGNVVYTNDEATGGVHLSLVLAGGLSISYEEADELKTDPKRSREVLGIVRPVIDKISSIVGGYLEGFQRVEKVCMVGGTCELEGLAEVVGQNLGLETFRPEAPQIITPFGIALSCLGRN